MENLVWLLGIILGIAAGFGIYTIGRRVAEKGFFVALLTAIGAFLIAGLVTRYIIPELTKAVAGMYGVAATNGLGLIMALGMFALTLGLIGGFLTSVPNLKPWHKQAIWGFTVFFGFIYGKILFHSEIKWWWANKVLPSEQPWAMGLENGSSFFIFVIGLAATLFVARWASQKF